MFPAPLVGISLRQERLALLPPELVALKILRQGMVC
jgi:hypothetical protein